MKHTNPGMECLLCRRPRMLTDIDVICKLADADKRKRMEQSDVLSFDFVVARPGLMFARGYLHQWERQPASQGNQRKTGTE